MNQTPSLDNNNFETTADLGVSLAEQNVPITITSPPDPVSMSARATSHLPEKSWDIESMLRRMNYVATVNWPLTAPPGTLLQEWDVVADLLQNELSATPFMRFIYFRCQYIRLHFQLTASRFFQGRAIVAFRPTQRKVTSTPVPFDLPLAYTLEKAFLDPANSTVVSLRVPFAFLKGYMNLTSNDSLGQLQLLVFNQFQAAAGSPTFIAIKVFVSFEGAEFKVPQPGGMSFRRLATFYNEMAESMQRTSIRDKKIETIDTSEEEAFEVVRKPRKQSGLLALGAETLLKPLIKEILPDNVIGDLIGGLLDKPQESLNPDPVVRKTQGYLSHAVNVDHVDKLSLYPNQQQMTDPEHFATSQDEMSIDYLLQRKPGYVLTASWSSTQDVATLLFSDYIGPLGGTPTPRPMASDFIASQFTYWRGGFYYIIDVVCSQFHEGRLDVIFSPGQLAVPVDYSTAMSQYVASFTVRNGKNRFKVRIPFLSDTPYKRIYNGGNVTTDPTVPNNLDFGTYFTGTMAIYVSVPLRNPATVVSNVDVNIFKGCESDFEFNMPNMYGNCFLYSSTGVPSTEIAIVKPKKQSGEVSLPTDINQPVPEEDNATLGVDTGETSDPSNSHFGEKYRSLREMCKRYTPLGTFPISSITANPTDPNYVVTSSGQAPVITVVPLNYLFQYQAFLSKVSMLFRNIRGPLCFKLRYRVNLSSVDPTTVTSITNTWSGWVTFVPNGAFAPALSGLSSIQAGAMSSFPCAFSFTPDGTGANQCQPRSYFDANNNCEFEIPFPSHTATALLAQESEVMSEFEFDRYYGPMLVIASYNPNVQTTTADILGFYDIDVAFGDETHFGTFIGFPFQTFRSLPQWPNRWDADLLKKKKKNQTPIPPRRT